MFFEQAREQAEREFTANNKDALVRIRFIYVPTDCVFILIVIIECIQALTKWGGALLELAHFRQGQEAYSMIEDAIAKFQQALDIDDARHDALWCLGNAYTSQGFLSPTSEKADEFFNKAGDCFKKAVEFEPTNDSYKRALEMSSKAPQLYAELQKQLQAAGGAMGGGEGRKASGGDAAAGNRKEPMISDFWYDVAGWVVLVGIGFGVAALSSRAATTAA